MGLDAIAGWIGELYAPQESSSSSLRRRQALREYNALLERTSPDEPGAGACLPCLAAGKAQRRKERHDLIRKTQANAVEEADPLRQRQLLAAADRLAGDMERVEDARIAAHVYTAHPDGVEQAGFLQPLREQAPPGFRIATVEQVAEDFGIDSGKLRKLIDNPANPSQKIMFYERDTEVLGPGSKYKVAFRGSTSDRLDWNNNGRNEAGYEAPHQKNAARLGALLRDAGAEQGLSIDDLISATGHSKGGSEAQAFVAASGAAARVFNPAGFDPRQYAQTATVLPEQMRIDRTTVLDIDASGRINQARTDPLYYAQHEGLLSKYLMKKPVTSGAPRELAPIDPNLSVPSAEQSPTEAHSMLQVIEALERDKRADQELLQQYRPAMNEVPFP